MYRLGCLQPGFPRGIPPHGNRVLPRVQTSRLCLAGRRGGLFQAQVAKQLGYHAYPMFCRLESITIAAACGLRMADLMPLRDAGGGQRRAALRPG